MDHPSPEDCLKILRILQDDHPESTSRRVRFNTLPSFNASLDSISLDMDSLWYQPAEITAFRKKARKSLKRFQKMKDLGLVTNAKFRGLECWALERRLYRHRTIQCTLSAHKRGMGPDLTAQIARRCTLWNEEIALLQASHDYCHAYEPAKASSIPKVFNVPPEFPFSLIPAISRTRDHSHISSKKRRRVRRRMR